MPSKWEVVVLSTASRAVTRMARCIRVACMRSCTRCIWPSSRSAIPQGVVAKCMLDAMKGRPCMTSFQEVQPELGRHCCWRFVVANAHVDRQKSGKDTTCMMLAHEAATAGRTCKRLLQGLAGLQQLIACSKNIAFKRRMPYMPGQPVAKETRCPLCR